MIWNQLRVPASCAYVTGSLMIAASIDYAVSFDILLN
jgi:hypothetical protein